jgi:Domain of unknown function (DUF4397)/LysM domain
MSGSDRHHLSLMALTRKVAGRSLSVFAVGAILLLCSPSTILARALVRFVHGVPGAGRATVQLNTSHGAIDVGSIGFAQHTRWHSIPSGKFGWTLVGGTGKRLARGTATVGDGAYDIVVWLRGTSVRLGIFKTRSARPGTTLLRVIHAAPELGSPELMLDGKEVVKRLSYAQATPYLSISPGTHSLAAQRPGSASPQVSVPHVSLAPGVAYSAIVLGSRGQRVRVALLTDRGASRGPRSSRVGGKHAAGGSGWAVVAPGDSLWAIASGHLGPGADDEQIAQYVQAIWNLNSARIGTGDPNLIFAGQRIKLPQQPV